MNGDRAIRVATAGVVLAVAAFAAIVSYSHIYDLGHAHGQSGTAARMLPLSVDGLILAASLVMLQQARNNQPAPALARLMLGLGVTATIGANIAYGTTYGTTGALISAWPAIAFIGAAELLMTSIRRIRNEPDQVPEPTPVPDDVSHTDLLQTRATQVFADELAAGRIPSIRAIRSQLRIGQPRAQLIRAYLNTLPRRP